MVVWVIVWVSGQWIPLVVALLVLQSAGMAAPGMPRKWLSRGFSVLWTLLLTPVMVLIIWRVGKVGLESNTGYLGLLSGVLVLLACAFSFLIVQRMLPMGEGAGMGIGAAVMSASYLAGRASSAARRPGPSREQLAQRQLEHGGRPGRRRRVGRRQRRRARRPGPARASLRSRRRRGHGGGSTAAPAGATATGPTRVIHRSTAAERETPADPGAPDSWVDRLTARLTNAAAQKIPVLPERPTARRLTTRIHPRDRTPEPVTVARDPPGPPRPRSRSASPASSMPADPAQQHVPPAAADEGSRRDQSDRPAGSGSHPAEGRRHMNDHAGSPAELRVVFSRSRAEGVLWGMSVPQLLLAVLALFMVVAAVSGRPGWGWWLLAAGVLVAAILARPRDVRWPISGRHWRWRQ